MTRLKHFFKTNILLSVVYVIDFSMKEGCEEGDLLMSRAHLKPYVGVPCDIGIRSHHNVSKFPLQSGFSLKNYYFIIETGCILGSM